ncbi:MAG: DUF11 domain-containing protein [Halofilum sp. (in: g-proteobacteria)]|nr:DUF11 domain-containing protein [Halofilum sp. (in: g-proteobacteria)]
MPTTPSDDPDTPIADDPTQTIVGAAPLIDVQKTVSASTEPVQSGASELTYTILVSNNGTAPATGTVLIDDVPADTTYVAGSTTLNGVAVPDGAGGASPLSSGEGGLPVSSSDLVPPGALPDADSATVNPGESATVVFRVTVDSGLADGTVIGNQGTLTSDQQPDEPTDADGNDENGDQPTTVIVGGQPSLAVSKEVFVVGGGTLQPDGLLDYAVRVENTGPVEATNVTITDDLDAPVPGQLEYIPGFGWPRRRRRAGHVLRPGRRGRRRDAATGRDHRAALPCPRRCLARARHDDRQHRRGHRRRRHLRVGQRAHRRRRRARGRQSHRARLARRRPRGRLRRRRRSARCRAGAWP